MVSRRNFITIVLMMAVMFVLFQFSQIIIDESSQFDFNAFVVEDEELLLGTGVWQEGSTGNISVSQNGYVLFFSKENKELKSIVSQWCTYTKRGLMIEESLRDFSLSETLPELILLDTQNIELGANDSWLGTIMDCGVPVVFCNLPQAAEIKTSQKLREILGIKEVRSLETQVEGLRMFEGFFLGGEVLYQPKTLEEWERLDFDLTMPWYVMDSGTKTYMVGIKDEDEVEREEFPSVIWRNTYENTKVFAINGYYMSGLTGLGILDVITYELYPYELYPVVNAQNIVIANFPGFSEENGEELMRIYSRNPQMTFQDIMWPSISAMAKTNQLKLTCMFQPQYDYTDEIEPETEKAAFYLQQLKQLNSEAGMTLQYKDTATFEEMLEADEAFYEALSSEYRYQTVFAENTQLENVKGALQTSDLLKQVRTITSEYNGEYALLSYITDEVTLQNTTATARKHSYMDNLTVRSLQTALGYSNVLLDLHRAVWPESVSDQWQHLYDDMASNVQTYWSGDSGFEQTTLSESDLRVRSFLNLDYTDTRREDTIILEVENYGKEAWFILRTHEEKIVDIRGGEYEKLEENAYLIHVLEDVVEIDVKALSLKEQGAKTW